MVQSKKMQLSFFGTDIYKITKLLDIDEDNVLGEWYAGNTTSGGTLVDLTGKGRNLTNNGATPVVNSSLADGDGNVLQAFSYNGSSQYHSLAHADWMNVFDGDFSIIALVKTPSSTPGAQINILSHGSLGVDGGGVHISTAGYMGYFLNNSGLAPNFTGSTGGTNICDGNYHILHWTRSGTTIQMYYDGIAGTASVISNSAYGLDGSRTLYMGCNEGPANYWSSHIAYVRLQNNALTYSQIMREVNLFKGIMGDLGNLRLASPTFQRSSTSYKQTSTGTHSLTQVAANWPVINEDAVLIQGSVTQVLTYTSDFSTNWTKTRCSIANTSVVLPDGTTGTTNTLKEDDSAATTHMLQANLGTLAIGTNYCYSIYVKYNSVASIPREWIRLYIDDNVAVSSAHFNIRYGYVGTLNRTAIVGGYGIQPIKNGWYRIWVWIKAENAATGHTMLHIGEGNNDLTINTTVPGGQDSFFIAFPQVEANAFPTTYISRPTATAASRSADSLTYIPWKISKNLRQFVNATPRLLFMGNESLNGATVTPTIGSYTFTKNGRPQNNYTNAEGDCFSFNGSTDYLSLASSDFNPSGNFSAVVSFTPLSITGTQYIAGKWDTAGNYGWRLYLSTTTMAFSRSVNGTTHTAATVASAIEVGKPVLVTATYSTIGGLTVRVDAMTAGTQAAIDPVFASTAPLTIGSTGVPDNYFTGKLHYLAYYDNYVISATEHSNMYAAFKQDGILPLVMSSTSHKTKLHIEFEAKCQFTGLSDIGTSRVFLTVSGNTGGSSGSKNYIGIYAASTGKVTIQFTNDTDATARTAASGTSDVVYSSNNKYYMVIDLSDLSQSDLMVNGVSEKDTVSNLSGSHTIYFKDSLIRFGQAFNSSTIAHAGLRNVKIWTE